MANGNAAGPPQLLADALHRLATRDRWALVQHLNDGIAHANQVADYLRTAEHPPAPTLHQVEVHLLAAIGHLELAAGALGLDPVSRARPRPWWFRWWPWRR